jgi:membrane peptidoglycan carboxypeptidase
VVLRRVRDNTVSLTINKQLQEIAERGLADGIQTTGATGGDVVIMDPRDGSVLAMAGVRNRKASLTATALAEPYEAGSVMKVFVISRALDLKRVHADQMINTEGGKWLVAKRTITDEHKAAYMSVRDVIRLSSNIGAAKIGTMLSQREEYSALRDFGFGTLTGVPYPAESRGQLPSEWNAQTPTAVAIGYEVSATPLQIATAYAAIANGGELLQPAVVREVRDPEGHVVFTHERRVIRRVLSPETAHLMRDMLASVVDSGTAVAADLATFDVGGKSGTARRTEGRRGYVPGKYNSSFAGMFPIQAPQFRPGGATYRSRRQDLRRHRSGRRGERDPAGLTGYARCIARPSRTRRHRQANSDATGQGTIDSRNRRSHARFRPLRLTARTSAASGGANHRTAACRGVVATVRSARQERPGCIEQRVAGGAIGVRTRCTTGDSYASRCGISRERRRRSGHAHAASGRYPDEERIPGGAGDAQVNADASRSDGSNHGTFVKDGSVKDGASSRGNVTALLDALRDAGLLVSVSDGVPDTISDLVDDSRRVTPVQDSSP